MTNAPSKTTSSRSSESAGKSKDLSQSLFDELLTTYYNMRLLPFVTTEGRSLVSAGFAVDEVMHMSFRTASLREMFFYFPDREVNVSAETHNRLLHRVESDLLATVSEMVGLFRFLWRSPNWRDMMVPAFQTNLPSVDEWLPAAAAGPNRGTSAEGARGKRVLSSGLGYLFLMMDALGGHLEGLRVGGTALILPWTLAHAAAKPTAGEQTVSGDSLKSNLRPQPPKASG